MVSLCLVPCVYSSLSVRYVPGIARCHSVNGGMVFRNYPRSGIFPFRLNVFSVRGDNVFPFRSKEIDPGGRFRESFLFCRKDDDSKRTSSVRAVNFRRVNIWLRRNRWQLFFLESL